MAPIIINSILLLIGLFLVLTITAEASSESSVETNVNIDLINGTTFAISFSTDVNYITLPANEKTYTQEDIQQASSEILGAIKYAIKTNIVSQIKSSFPNCIISSSYELPQYESKVFFDEYNIYLTAEFFSLNKTMFSSDLINGLLDAGVFVNFSFPWTSLPGWNNTYTLILPENLGFKRTNGDVESNRISWYVFNEEEITLEEMGTITLKEMEPTTNPSQNETVSFVFSLNCTHPEETNMSILIKAQRVDMAKYDLLPSILTLPPSLPADAIRLSVDNNLLNYENIKDVTLSPYIDESIDLLHSSSFNQTFDISFIWDLDTTVNCSPKYMIETMDENPPVTGILTDPSVHLSFYNISAKAFFGLINAGATSNIREENVNFATVFDIFQERASSQIVLPPQVIFNQSNSFSWNHSDEFSGVFESENPPQYTQQNVTRKYDISLKSTDLNLLSFFTGKTEVNLGIGFEKTRTINVLARSSSLSIPHEIELPFINADAFRLCVDEHVFSNEEIEHYINQHEIQLENISRRMFPSIKGSAVNNQNVFEESLQWDKNITSMVEKRPILLKQSMESTAPLSCQFSLLPPDFSFDTQNLTFIGVPDETVIYNVTFPHGISINLLSSSQSVIRASTPDGRELLSLRLNASDTSRVATVVLSIEPTLLYVIGLFVPCIVSVFITILLFFVVYVIRKKRNMLRQSKRKPSPSEYDEGYENEDYYVPPKPPSSR